MRTEKHTRGPLIATVPPSSCLTSRHIQGPNGEPVASVGLAGGYSCGTFADVANADRIVACWNACEKMEDPGKTILDLIEASKDILRLNGVKLTENSARKESAAFKTVERFKSALAKATGGSNE